MRKIFFLHILTLLSSLSLAQQEKLKIVASASMIADIAQNIIGDEHEVEMIVPIGGDPHLHEPTPSNARQVAAANLILINGLTFEGWITELIENSGTNASTVIVTEGVNALKSAVYDNSADPHAWMDVTNAIIYAENIKNGISKIDPDHTDVYQSNFEKYRDQLEQLDREIFELIAAIPEKQRVLITSHDAFQYYGKRYGILLEAIMGISTEAEAQTADIIRVNKVIQENQVPALFIESTINPKLIEQLAADNQVKIGGSLYADSLGDKDSPASSYIDMMRYNTNTIVDALKKEKEESNPDSKEQSGNRFFIPILIGILLLVSIIMFLKMRS